MQQVQESFRKHGVSHRWIHSFFSVLVTYWLQSTIAVLLSGCTGKASADVGLQRITAFLGKTVILPCSINSSHDFLTVEWSKEGLSKYVFVYRDGCEMFDEKNPDFRYRTSLIMNELQNGNLSLRITDLQLSDRGTYRCRILRGQPYEDVARLELDVVAMFEPKLTVVPNVTDGLTVQCEVECWLPEPEITFLDDQGNKITAEKPERTHPSGLCPTIIRKAKIQTATKRVTCRVHQQQLNVTRDTEIHIAENCVGFYVKTIIITVIVTLLVSGLVWSGIKWRNVLRNWVMGQISPGSYDQSGPSLIQTDNVGCAELSKEKKQLESTLRDKHKEIHRLTANLKGKEEEIHRLTANLKGKEEEIHRLTAKLKDPIPGQNNVWQKDQSADDARSSVDDTHKPKPAAASTGSQKNVPETKDQIQAVPRQNPAAKPQTKPSRYESAPILRTDGDAALSSFDSGLNSGETSTRTRSMSHLGLNTAKPQRRHTMSVMVKNRYKVLENLTEEF